MEDKKLMNEENAAEDRISPATESEEVVDGTIPASADANDEKPVSKKKKIVNAILLGLQILVVLIAFSICLVVIINPLDNTSTAAVQLYTVQSPSMDGKTTLTLEDGTEKEFSGFPANSLVLGVKPSNDGNDLKIGDIVTFEMDLEMGGKVIRGLNTHRIVGVKEVNGVRMYMTQGDAYAEPDKLLGSDEIDWKYGSQMKTKYVFHISGLGIVFDWIRDGSHFIYVIIIPLALLLIYNIYLVAQIVVEGKMKKARALAAESAKEAALASIDEEEIKRRAIEEYLRSQASAAEKPPQDDKGDTE